MSSSAWSSQSTQNDEAADHDAAETLTGLVENITPDIALRVWKKHNRNLEAAANALFEGDRGEPSTWPDLPPLEPATRGPLNSPRPRSPYPSRPENENAVIDLTQDDDDDMAKALRMSLENETPVRGRSPGPAFQRSDRTPDPAWAMVPSNSATPPTTTTTTTGMSQEDERVQRAIEASLEDSFLVDEDMYETPLAQRVRIDNRPVSLRSQKSSFAYAGLVPHVLYFIPQVRAALLKWSMEVTREDKENMNIRNYLSANEDHDLEILSTLTEVYVNMQHAKVTELASEDLLNAVHAEPWESAIERPGDLSHDLLKRFAFAMDVELYRKLETWRPLFHFRYCTPSADLPDKPLDRGLDRVVVKVEIPDDAPKNDLVSCLAAQLTRGQMGTLGALPLEQQSTIVRASEVVAFQLVRVQSYSSGGSMKKGDKAAFRYPKHIYLDQFMRENVELADEKRREEQDMALEIAKLAHQREELTKYKNKDTLADLRSTLHYFENVAEHNEDSERKAQIQDVAIRLRKTVARLENEIETIDAQITQLKGKSAVLYDCPELKQHRYDLRAVLVHDGLFGRMHLYSYVEQNGVWWKTVDHMVTEVSEDAVLTDASGLHLGAGPYFLFYSRALSPEDEAELATLDWPANMLAAVEEDNQQFFMQMTPRTQARLLESEGDAVALVQSSSSSDIEPGLLHELMESQDTIMDVSS